MRWLTFLSDVASNCCGTILILLVVAVVVARVRERLWLRTFCRSHSGQAFLIASRRGGWYDFVQNNVVPTLPDNACIAWATRGRDGLHPSRRALKLSRLSKTPRPSLMVVTPHGIGVVSLHAELQPLKAQTRRRDASTQRAVSVVLRDAMMASGLSSFDSGKAPD